MQVIYEPRGRAREYSPLAVNLYTGCVHGCAYCFGPDIPPRKTPAEFQFNVQPRKNILEKLEKDCKKIEGDPRQILLCFTCDPYQPTDQVSGVTRDALLILEKYHMNVSILTKGGMRAFRNFDILLRNDWEFGTTITTGDVNSAWAWEPNAAHIHDRVRAMRLAKEMGIKTWVSIEPVINPKEALEVIEDIINAVDHWKIGKINHMPEIEREIDWGKFLQDTEKILEGKSYYIKKDLERYRK